MHQLFMAFIAAALVAGPAVASDKTDVMVPVRQFIDGFNKGDVKSALAACADQVSIIDEFAPYEWHGAGACANWASDFDADAKRNGITDGSVTLGSPRHLDITNDRAYVVVPATYVFRVKGKRTKEAGARLPLALQKGAAGWRITAWTWTKP